MSGTTVRRERNDQYVTRLVVNQSSPGTLELMAAVANKRHKLVRERLTLSAVGTMKYQSGSTDLTGPMDVSGTGGFVDNADDPLIQTAVGEALNLVTTGGAARGAVLIVTE